MSLLTRRGTLSGGSAVTALSLGAGDRQAWAMTGLGILASVDGPYLEDAGPGSVVAAIGHRNQAETAVRSRLLFSRQIHASGLFGSPAICYRLAAEDSAGDALEPNVEPLAADAGTKTDTPVSFASSWFSRDGVDAIFDIPPHNPRHVAVRGRATDGFEICVGCCHRLADTPAEQASRPESADGRNKVKS